MKDATIPVHHVRAGVRPGLSHSVARCRSVVVARLRRAALRALCRRTRALRRSLSQWPSEIYICP